MMMYSITKRLLRRPLVSSRLFGTSSSSGTLLHHEWIGPSHHHDERAPPIVFLHGLLGNSRNIRTMANKTCELKKRPGPLIDITGHGKSASSSSSSSSAHPVDFHVATNDIQHTISTAVKTDTVTMVGDSLGGRLALYYATLQKQNHGPVNLNVHC